MRAITYANAPVIGTPDFIGRMGRSVLARIGAARPVASCFGNMDRWVAELATDTARDPEECRQVAEWLRETVMAATAGVEDVRQRVVIAHGVFSYCAAQVRDHQAGEHLVYLLYDGSGSLLYVGITDRGPQRLVEHYRTKPWFHQVARIEFERHVTRDKAAARETKLIRQRHPRFNVIHNRAARVAA